MHFCNGLAANANPLKGVDHADAEKVTGIFAPAQSGTPPDSWMF